MSVQRELHALVDDMCGEDHRRALAAFRCMANEQMPWLERRVVTLARRRGASWAAIGRLLGRSRQALQQRFDRVIPIGEMARRLTPGEIERVEQERVLRLVDDFRSDRRPAVPDECLPGW